MGPGVLQRDTIDWADDGAGLTNDNLSLRPLLKQFAAQQFGQAQLTLTKQVVDQRKLTFEQVILKLGHTVDMTQRTWSGGIRE